MRALKEVIVSAGSIDTPKVLLLSGIGPAEELASLGINVKHNLQGVGKHLRDHYGTWVISQVDGEMSDRKDFETSTASNRPARNHWLEDTTGYYSTHHNSFAWAFLRDEELLKTQEFAHLNDTQQRHLRNPEVPLYKIISVGLSFLTIDLFFVLDILRFLVALISGDTADQEADITKKGAPSILPDLKIDENATTLQCFVFLMNAQSTGSITLQSADPRVPPLIHLGFMQHAYDRMVLRHAVREAMKLSTKSSLGRIWQKYLVAPKSESDEDILVSMAFVSWLWEPL